MEALKQNFEAGEARMCLPCGNQCKSLSYGPLVWALTLFKASALWAPVLKVVSHGFIRVQN